MEDSSPDDTWIFDKNKMPDDKIQKSVILNIEPF